MPQIEATDERSFEALPAGEYTLVTVKATDGFSEKSNNQYVKVQLQEPESKKTIFFYAVFVKSVADKVTNFWRALGHNVKKGELIDFTAADVPIGVELRAWVTTRDYNGDLQNDIKTFILPDPAETKKPAAPVPTKKPIQPF
jgi:hypothetical protein